MNSRNVVVCVVGAMILQACAALPPVKQETAGAAELFHCPEKDITLAPLAGETRIARGCGQEAWFTCVKVIDAGRWDNACFKMQDLKKRSLFELDCKDANGWEATPLDDLGHVVGVTACNRKMTYQYVQVARGYDWVPVSTNKPINQ